MNLPSYQGDPLTMPRLYRAERPFAVGILVRSLTKQECTENRCSHLVHSLLRCGDTNISLPIQADYGAIFMMRFANFVVIMATSAVFAAILNNGAPAETETAVEDDRTQRGTSA